jgi:flagellar biosynthesis component FlhA
MEAILMKLPVGIISTAVLSLILGIAAPLYAQEQHEEQKDQQEQKDKPAKPEEKNAQEAKPKQEEEKSAQENKNTKQEEKTTQQHEQQAKGGEQAQHNRIPDDKFRANFGREHTFRVSESDYRNHRFAYGGYSFGFVGVWPSNWLYTQDVFVVDIGGVYYLCNPMYPGVNLELSFTL